VTLANVPALGGLRAGARYHASVTVVHPGGSRQSLVQANMVILEIPLSGLGYQVLLGRDLLDHCDFVYGGRRQRFVLTY
jgi:hypothetical protein